MWLSSTARQALDAVLFIAEAEDAGPVRVNDVATALGVPRNYLSKTLHLLARAGVLRSGRGRGGGFRLAQPADRLTLARVIAPFEPVDERRCLVGRPTCGDATACQAHERWKKIAARVDRFFGDTTVASLRRRPASARNGRAAPRPGRHLSRSVSHGSVGRRRPQ